MISIDSKIRIDSAGDSGHAEGMAMIGERTTLRIRREKPFGLYLDAGELGEVLLPRGEIPPNWDLGGSLEVFIYTDSEDRPVATCRVPKAVPGQFAKLTCVAVNHIGAFLDWGLVKELMVPFREQARRMEVGKSYFVRVLVDEVSGRILATTRLGRFLDQTPHAFEEGQEVDLQPFSQTPLGYKMIINGTHSGILFANEVFQPLVAGEKLRGFITKLRSDGKIDLSLHPPGRGKVSTLEETILAELRARGGFWAIGDHSSAAEIHDELGVSKRTFKQAIGSLFKKRQLRLEERGIRLEND